VRITATRVSGAKVRLSVAAVVTIVLTRPGLALDPATQWMTDEKLAVVKAIGIDPEKDLETMGRFHWDYIASKPLAVGGYSCPTGSVVVISRNNVTRILPPEGAACTDANGRDFKVLKLSPSGSAEPIQ
jgi:hypothetical protein